MSLFMHLPPTQAPTRHAVPPAHAGAPAHKDALLGHLISQGRFLFKSDQIIVGMVTIGIIGILLDSAVLSIQRILLRWKDTR